MAGELCGTGCGFCGRCDGPWDREDDLEIEDGPEPCQWCGSTTCSGDCEAFFEALAEDNNGCEVA